MAVFKHAVALLSLLGSALAMRSRDQGIYEIENGGFEDKCEIQLNMTKSECTGLLMGWLEARSSLTSSLMEFMKLAEAVLLAQGGNFPVPGGADTEYNAAMERVPVGAEPQLTKLHIIMDMAFLLSCSNIYDDSHITSKFWATRMDFPWAESLPQFEGVKNQKFAHWPASSNLVRALGASSPLYKNAIVPEQRARGNWKTDASSAVRVVTISDTHLFHNRVPQLPPGDILIHAGDLLYESSRPPMASKVTDIILDIRAWFERMCENYRAIVLVGGNHDEPMSSDDRYRYDEHVIQKLHSSPCLKEKLIPLRNKAVALKIHSGNSSKTLRIFGTPLSSDAKLGNNKAFQYIEPTEPNARKVGIPLSELQSRRHEMLKDYEEAVRSKQVSVFVTHGPFEGTRSAKRQGVNKGSLPTSAGSGAILHVFGHWHEPEKTDNATMLWVNPAVLNRINAPQFPGYTIDIPFEGLPDVDETSPMDLPLDLRLEQPFAGAHTRSGVA